LQLADPIATFLFSILVVFSTVNLVKGCFNVLMEGTPDGFDPDKIATDIVAIPDVLAVHDLHMWSLTLGKPAMSVHVVVPVKTDGAKVLESVRQLLRSKKIKHSTIQIEEDSPDNTCIDDHKNCYSHTSKKRE
jgi:zinc transporter 2